MSDLNGDTLSLVLTKSSNLDDYTEYYAYNLNLTDGTRMSAKELAQLLVRGVPTDADDFDDFDESDDDFDEDDDIE